MKKLALMLAIFTAFSAVPVWAQTCPSGKPARKTRCRADTRKKRALRPKDKIKKSTKVERGSYVGANTDVLGAQLAEYLQKKRYFDEQAKGWKDGADKKSEEAN